MNKIQKLKIKLLGEDYKQLWTYDFLIIVIGSFVSLSGMNALVTAIGLLTLDLTRSNLMYSLVLAVTNVSGIIVPVFAAAVMDRFSRRKIIYSFDFFNAALLFIMAFLYTLGIVNGPIILVYCFIIGLVNNVYAIAYESYVPLIVEKSLYNKAYSISSIVSTIAETATLLGIFFYKFFGIIPVFLVSGALYFTAACFETRIKTDVAPLVSDAGEKKESAVVRYMRDFTGGLRYLACDRALLALSVVFVLQCLSLGSFYAIVLPFFYNGMPNGEFYYILVMSFMSTGQFWGGLIGYRLKIKPGKKAGVFLALLIIQYVSMTAFVKVPVALMTVLLAAAGIIEVLLYSMRGAVIYQGLPVEMVTRYTGIFQSLRMIGMVTGNLCGGLLCEVMPVGAALVITNGVTILCAAILFSVFRKPLRAMFSKEPPKTENEAPKEIETTDKTEV